MKYFAVALCGLLLPISLFAAGFAKQSLFLSKPSVTEGETVLIHAVISNEAGAKFTGELVFKDGESKIGTAPVSLGAGEAQTASVSWRPSAGTHAVTAELMNGAEITEKQSASFVVAPKPNPTASAASQSASTIQSSQGIQQKIADLSPQAAQASAPLFTLIDSGRTSAADFVEAQITETKKKMEKDPDAEVSGAQTEKLPDTVGGFWSALNSLYLYILMAFLFVISNAGIFYPLLAIAFLYCLYRLYKRFRRPAY
jgi:hypothetical protein